MKESCQPRMSGPSPFTPVCLSHANWSDPRKEGGQGGWEQYGVRNGHRDLESPLNLSGKWERMAEECGIIIMRAHEQSLRTSIDLIYAEIEQCWSQFRMN